MVESHGAFPITRGLIQAATASSQLLQLSAADLPIPPPVGEWGLDLLGRGHEAQTVPLGEDSEGEIFATVVRYRPEVDPDPPPAPQTPRFAVLYLHGWSDYLLNPEIGPFWAGEGGAFYAVDLRKYGRSLRAGQTPGYITDLADYDVEIAAARELIEADHPGLPLVLMAHSTGGLTATLWAARHVGEVAALVLVAPWLELQGSSLARMIATPIVEATRLFPKGRLLNPDLGFYSRTIDRSQEGEWDLVPAWRPPHSFPATNGWAAAVLDGHAKVAAGFDVGCPILLLRSARTLIQVEWSDEMRRADTVVDVNTIARRALRLSDDVTVSTLEGALHDVLLSAPPIRAEAYRRIARWGKAYLP